MKIDAFDDLAEPWWKPDEQNAAAMVNQLYREWLTEDQQNVTCLARRSDNDDCLFHIPGMPAPFAVIHLTWATKRSPVVQAEFYKTLNEWIELRYRPDVANWTA